MSRKVLGRGLDALISHEPQGSETADGDRIRQIPIGEIHPNPDQPRRRFDPSRLDELSRSIRERGVLEPLIVRQREDGTYQLIAGERRLRAARLAGHSEIPAILRDFKGEESLEVALIENLQREDLNPVDEARAYQRLSDEFARTHAEISDRVGKDRSTITNLLRLLRLPDQILESVSCGTLSVGHARVLLAIEDANEQIRMAERMTHEGWNVRQAERHVAGLTKRPAKKRKPSNGESGSGGREVLRVEDALRYALGTEVHLFHSAAGGRIEICYSGAEELERILDLIGVKVH
jgi:ParB family transcriptional regulator, chromosome partitioning protein